MDTSRRNAVAALIAAGLLWGTTVPLSKLALQWLAPGWLTAVRFGLAAAVLLPVARRRGGRRCWGPGRRRRRSWPPGRPVTAGTIIVQNAGIARTSVTHAALLIGAVPVLVAVIAALWHREVARPVAWLGYAISLGGVGLVTAGGGGGGATAHGDVLVMVSLVMCAAFTVAQGRLLRGRDPIAVTAVQFLGAALGALACHGGDRGRTRRAGRPRAGAGRRGAGALPARWLPVHPVRLRAEPGAGRDRRGLPQPRAAGRRDRGSRVLQRPGRAEAAGRRSWPSWPGSR